MVTKTTMTLAVNVVIQAMVAVPIRIKMMDLAIHRERNLNTQTIVRRTSSMRLNSLSKVQPSKSLNRC